MTDYVLALQKLRVKDMYHQFVWLCGELWIRPSVKSRPTRVSQSKLDKIKEKASFSSWAGLKAICFVKFL